MIPIWLLTVLYCLSAASAVAVLGLLAWHYFMPGRNE